MSSYRELETRCDNCRTMAPIRLWRIVEVRSDPELKGPLLAGELHNPRCPSCGASMGFLPPSLLYADPVTRLLAWCSCLQQKPPDPREIRRTVRMRAMTNLDTLAETVRILDDGLDDGVVLMIKASILQAMKDWPDGRGRLTYAGIRTEGGKRRIAFECAALPGLDVMPEPDAYDDAKSEYGPRIAALISRDPWLLIDDGFAARVEATDGMARQASPYTRFLDRFIRRRPER